LLSTGVQKFANFGNASFFKNSVVSELFGVCCV
jgi:hypothetical protein